MISLNFKRCFDYPDPRGTTVITVYISDRSSSARTIRVKIFPLICIMAGNYI